MILKPIYDQEHIKALLLKDNIYKNILGKDELNIFNIPKKDTILSVIEDNKNKGLVYLQPKNAQYVSFHGGIYKEFRGEDTYRIFKKALKLAKRIAFPLHIFCTIKDDNKAAIRLVEAAKFKFKKTIKLDGNDYRVYVE